MSPDAIALVLATACPAAATGVDWPTPREAEAIAAEAYVFGLPLVEVYRGIYLGAVGRGAEGQHAFNELRHRTAVFGAGDKGVRRPNADTAYSQLLADLRAEPLILSVPAVEEGRYHSVQFIDLFTHNFGYVGSRATGNGAGHYLLAGPSWDGEPPHGIDGVLRSETELAVVLCRVQVRDRADVENASRIQTGYQVEPLSAFLGEPPPAPPETVFPPYDQKRAQALGFFGYLGFLLRFCPTHPSEGELRARLASIGVAPDRAFEPASLPIEVAQALERGLAAGRAAVAARIQSGSPLVFGSRELLDNDYLARAAAAQAGIFGNSREEALYTLLSTDVAGTPLDGSTARYTLQFAPDELPPVRGFWSVTLYTQPEGLFFANPLERNLINSPMLPGLARDADGGLTLRIQHGHPGS